MIAVILAAGYATRLYPLTRDLPKPLLEVGGRPILEHLLAQLDPLEQVSRVVLVSNHRFRPAFHQWQARRRRAQSRDGATEKRGNGETVVPKDFTLLDDGSTANENRLGALGDLRFALEQTGLQEDLFVCAADNLFLFSLAEFFQAFARRRAAWVCVHQIADLARLRRTGVARLDADHRVIEFAEKPPEPQSQWAVPPLYLYPRELLPLIQERLGHTDRPDSPGALIEWLCPRAPVYAHPIQGEILDIGDPQSLAAARQRADLGTQ